MATLKIFSWTCALIAAMSLSLSQARADLIVNGGFETGDFTGWTTGPNTFPQFIVGSPVHSGHFAAQIAGFSNRPDTLSQAVTTSPGQSYDLSFWRFVDGGGPTILLTGSWDGQQIFSEFNTGSQPYQQFSFNVVGTGSDTLLFTSANDPSFTYLDDVSLTPSTITPEPSSMALLGGCMICLAIRAIRRRRHLSTAV